MQLAMKIAFLALLGVASAQTPDIEIPDNEIETDTILSMPAPLLSGEQSEPVDAVAPASLLEKHTAVQSNQALRSKILEKMAGLRKQAQATGLSTRYGEAVSLSASSNLLGEKKTNSLAASLMQTAADASLQEAVQKAVAQKSNKRVTLEELIVVEDKAKGTMDDVQEALSAAFTDMMESHKQCNTCKNDCHALQWKKYKVHTMAECQKNCKVVICKESSKQEAEEFEAELQKAPQYATSKFSSYIQDYAKAHSQEQLVHDDDDKFEIVWEVPGDTLEDAKEEITLDPVEQLRAMDKFAAQKSSEDILKNLHKEMESKKQEQFVKAIQ